MPKLPRGVRALSVLLLTLALGLLCGCASSPAVRASATTDRGTGTLAIRMRPEGEVFVDGRPVGPAPVSVDLPSGLHRVRLRSVSFNVDEEITVMIHAGETETRSLTLTP